ncbi:putative bifunctional diguanylate cyclase/phosphodiesterase [Plastoroseomonas hellenica]|uniref:putative bifunctional diguanylate cyclase/phosphodiesterase n=1 Tax=Plastoroseomonas hellenica TaxID=2687306 RepID=UPI001BA9A0CB|nr:EAL domain-containing protein [Plastoroseomonas hellenica]MBR0642822.1 EAL domain-containing protein [Plastoroseomonas hellenica]
MDVHPPSLLIVDDQDINRRVYAKLAATVAEGVRVTAFGDPGAAFAWLEENQPDVIITDYRMPGMDGAEFTRRVRAMPHGADVPIVVITVYNDRRFRLDALDAGATDFLLSPVDHSEFGARIRNLIALNAHRQMLRRQASALQRELDDSERSRQRLLHDSREALAQVIDTLPALISATGPDGRCVFVNANLAAALGHAPADIIGQDMAELLGERGARSRDADRMVLERGAPLPNYEEEFPDRDGRMRVFLTAKAPLRDAAGELVAVLTSSVDITERKLAETRLHHLAHHDSLTDLPNRFFLTERLPRGRQHSRRGDQRMALHFLDLDRFKTVNDVFGHHVGDGVLRAIARRLLGLVRSGDVVARLGGDEFAVLQNGVSSPDEAAALAERIAEAVSRPFLIEGREVVVGSSIGIALYPRDGLSADELLRRGDLAMYQAKADGGGSFRFFEAGMDASARRLMILETDLRSGLARNEFVLLYQPQLSLRTRRIVGVEALIRWQQPDGILLEPKDFLPLAEETGLIRPLGAWVLQEACRQAAQWNMPGSPPLRVAVNISPLQLRGADLVRTVQTVLAESGLDPTRLDLELTESAVIRDADGVAETLAQLRSLGLRISIDDFGTGYSALSYVRRLPVDRLKIDRSFVENLRPGSADAAIIGAIVALGHNLHLEVAAEGVETEEQVRELAACGCDEVQGYHVGRPMSAEALSELVLDMAAPDA